MPAAVLVMVGLAGSTRVALLLVFGGSALLFFLLALMILTGSPSAAFLRVCAALFLAILVILAGIMRVRAPHTRFSASIPHAAAAAIEGRVLEDLRPGSSPYRVLPVQVYRLEDRQGWQGSATGRVTVIWQGEEYLKARGTRIIPVRGDLIRITDLEGLTVTSRDPVLFTNPDSITVEAVPGIPHLRRMIRDGVRRRLARLDRRGGAMVPALLLGDRGSLSQELSDAVRVSGAAHVLALSGMHLGVLAVILHVGTSRILGRRFQDVLAVPVLAAYVWIAGWIPSLVRALVLILLARMARFAGRSVPVPLLLARTVVVTALLAPRIVGNVGFQLSLLALAGIVLLSPVLLDTLGRILPRPLAAYVGVTLAAMIATAPLSLNLFGSVYPAGIVLAGLLSALIVVQMWAGIAFMLFATTPLVGTVVAALIGVNARLVERIAGAGHFFPVMRAGPLLWFATGLVLTGLLVIVLRRLPVLRYRDEPRLDY